MRLVIKKHARDMMTVRGIDEEQIKKVIKRGSKTKQTDGLLATYTYMAVAYKVREDKYIIKTVEVLD